MGIGLFSRCVTQRFDRLKQVLQVNKAIFPSLPQSGSRHHKNRLKRVGAESETFGMPLSGEPIRAEDDVGMAF